jgi:uncharacterized membrane protein YidH (DUF202 family)
MERGEVEVGQQETNTGMDAIWKRIDDRWFYSKTAIGLFGTSATFVALAFVFGELWPRDVIISSSLTEQVPFTLAMMLLAVSELVVIVGMFRYWIRRDRSSRKARTIWFAIMIVGLFVGLGLGCALYCFAVYMPQTLRNPTARE